MVKDVHTMQIVQFRRHGSMARSEGALLQCWENVNDNSGTAADFRWALFLSMARSTWPHVGSASDKLAQYKHGQRRGNGIWYESKFHYGSS